MLQPFEEEGVDFILGVEGAVSVLLLFLFGVRWGGNCGDYDFGIGQRRVIACDSICFTSCG